MGSANRLGSPDDRSLLGEGRVGLTLSGNGRCLLPGWKVALGRQLLHLRLVALHKEPALALPSDRWPDEDVAEEGHEKR